MSSWSPVIVLALFRLFARCLYKISLTRELFPEPDTPVTHVIIPNGISTSIFFRLFSLAPFTVRNPAGVFRSAGTGICSFPLRYCPVMDSSTWQISSAVPCAITFPPREPAPGPISMIWSAAHIVSSSCSTTNSVFPISFRFFSVFISLSLSL